MQLFFSLIELILTCCFVSLAKNFPWPWGLLVLHFTRSVSLAINSLTFDRKQTVGGWKWNQKWICWEVLKCIAERWGATQSPKFCAGTESNPSHIIHNCTFYIYSWEQFKCLFLVSDAMWCGHRLRIVRVYFCTYIQFKAQCCSTTLDTLEIPSTRALRLQYNECIKKLIHIFLLCYYQ